MGMKNSLLREKIFAKCTSDTGFLSRIYKKTTSFYWVALSHPVHNWFSEHMIDVRQMINKDIKIP